MARKEERTKSKVHCLSALACSSAGACGRPLRCHLLLDPLSERELEVLRLLARGASNQEIAEELVVAVSTVKHHVSMILSKLGAGNRTQAVARARDLGLLSNEP